MPLPGIRHLVTADDGGLVVSADLRRERGVPDGGRLVASVRNGALVLDPFDTAVRRAQAMAAAYAASGESVVEAFLAERRAQAQAEEDD